jgi:SOS-response transcriptional repressor LexA
MTSQQARLLRFIADYQRDHAGASPSYDEMAGALGLKSRSGAHRLVAGLEERGHVMRVRNLQRSIRLTRPEVTVGDFRAAVARLVEQEGVDRAIGVLRAVERELLPRLGGAA